MQLHQLINCTPFACGFGLCLDKDGCEHAVAVLKPTFAFDRRGEVSIGPEEHRLPVFPADQFYDQPDNSSLRHASDITHEKSGTDIAILGRAYGGGQRCVEVGFRVGTLEKIVQASGPRHWKRSRLAHISGPEPFSALPLRYEHAYGGSYLLKTAGRSAYPYNPVGVGYADAAVEELLLPSFEYRESRFKNLQSRPNPAGFGFVPGHWLQRSQYAGTFDARWLGERRPLLPEDFDSRFHNAVPQDQVHQPKIEGGEQVTLIRLDADAAQARFVLPRRRFVAAFHLRDQVEEVPMEVDTLVIEPDEKRFSLTYRSALEIGSHFRALKSIRFVER